MIKIDQIIGGLRLATWGFLIAIAVFFIYLNGATKPILNFNNETNIVLYPEQCFKSPQELTQEYIDLCSIPQDYLKTDYLIIAAFLLIGLVATLISDKGKIPEMADIKEAQKITKDYLDSHKNIKLQDTGEIIDIGKYYISPNFLLPEERIGKDRIPERYVISAVITDLDDIEHNIRVYIHPFKRYLKGFVSADKDLEDSDRCTKCGMEFDVEYKDTEDLIKMKQLKKDWEAR